jgi:multisubunit Na+/H+ antiporter MnhB subunit
MATVCHTKQRLRRVVRIFLTGLCMHHVLYRSLWFAPRDLATRTSMPTVSFAPFFIFDVVVENHYHVVSPTYVAMLATRHNSHVILMMMMMFGLLVAH